MTPNAPQRFPFAAGLFLGLGMGGFFDGIVLHQILQWHHMATSAGFPAVTLEALRLNTLLDGLFHALTFGFVTAGLVLLWRASVRGASRWTGRSLVAALLIGFGLFNLAEGTLNHMVLGLHHVNETAPRDRWLLWDLGFLAWGLMMLAGGAALWRASGRGDQGAVATQPRSRPVEGRHS